MTRFIYRPLAMLAVLSIVGCASSAPQFYTLRPPLQMQKASVNTDLSFQGFVLKQVDVPLQLDRRQIALGLPASSQLQFLNDHQWASPLGDELQLALVSGLQSKLGLPELSASGVKGAYWQLAVAVTGFDSLLGQRVAQELSWSLLPKGFNAAHYQCRLQQTQAVEGDLPQLVQNHQALLSQFLDVVSDQMQGKPALPSAQQLLSCKVNPG